MCVSEAQARTALLLLVAVHVFLYIRVADLLPVRCRCGGGPPEMHAARLQLMALNIAMRWRNALHICTD